MAKYRRLLSVARSSLEANQQAMAEKDKQIDALRTALQAEIAKQSQMQMMQRAGAGGSGDEDGSSKPRRILRRVDVESKVWLLFDYPGGIECWSVYSSELEAADFVQRLPGEPLTIPTRSLTPEEGAKLVRLPHQIGWINDLFVFTYLSLMHVGDGMSEKDRGPGRGVPAV
jgi:hypothetical protein